MNHTINGTRLKLVNYIVGQSYQRSVGHFHILVSYGLDPMILGRLLSDCPNVLSVQYRYVNGGYMEPYTRPRRVWRRWTAVLNCLLPQWVIRAVNWVMYCR